MYFKEATRTFFPTPPLDFPSLGHSAASLMVDLFYGSICGGHTMCQAQLTVLKSHQGIKERFLPLKNFSLDGRGRQTSAFWKLTGVPAK